MEYLQGGRENKILKIGNVVQRPAGAWTPAVHALLKHVIAQGFQRVPQPLGIDPDGTEHVSFIPGHVSNYPLTPQALSQEALTSAAELLRNYHDATVSFLENDLSQYQWQLPPRSPAEVICHGDFAPYNVVLDGNTAVGIIDFDTAHPAPRLWDIAYALYRWAPFTSANNPDGIGTIEQQTQRACLFCAHYGLAKDQRQHLPSVISERLEVMVQTILNGAAAGNEAFQANIRDGHHLLYQADIAYVKANALTIAQAL